MSQLSGVPGELRFTITVKRAVTGLEETFEMVGTSIADSEQPLQQEKQNGSDPFDRSA